MVEMRDLVGTWFRFLARVVGAPATNSGRTGVVIKHSTHQRESHGTKISYAVATSDRRRIPAINHPASRNSEADEFANALETFASYPRCFTAGELADWLDTEVEPSIITQTLLNDSRFVRFSLDSGGDERFIPERTLFRWWSYLSLRLAQARQVRLTSRQLALALNSLRLEGRWDNPPEKAVQFGMVFGFVAPASTSGHYVFPLARILSFLSPYLRSRANYILATIADKGARDTALEHPLGDWVEEGFAKFNQRVVRVVQDREGLLTGTKRTLHQIGRDFRRTRERVRQLEARFWGTASRPDSIARIRAMDPFLKGLLFAVMRRGGSLMVGTEEHLTRFVAKFLGVPLDEIYADELDEILRAFKQDMQL